AKFALGPFEGRGEATTSVQFVPSNFQLSFKLPAPCPPKSTALPPRVPMLASTRKRGALPGCSSVQLEPSNVHVSLRIPVPAPAPPKRTILLPTDATATPWRSPGCVETRNSVQLFPSKIHVSLISLPRTRAPPKRTTAVGTE